MLLTANVDHLLYQLASQASSSLLPAPMARKQFTQPCLQAFPAKPPIGVVPSDGGSARYAEITDKKNRLRSSVLTLASQIKPIVDRSPAKSVWTLLIQMGSELVTY
ncbi:hypothetical protein PGT21_007152 [Puccinia graminis f. sp. tritici]|uniref:Uncharacterized protein n=1 Tax=Puccinia graminis f. sp. tritici TaxID=56615 RepID=A0A5B0PX12_PUCGR|nr:hypothetical protein PGT21_007152 [Puccinia graminis f. sp. tritici]